MTTSNTAVDAAKAAAEKAHEKLADKRRALGRGLESLLPGPRVVPATPAAGASSVVPAPHDADAAFSGGRPGSPVVAHAATPEVLESLQAVGAAIAPEGEHVTLLALDQIYENPHQTRQEFDPKALSDLAGSIQTQGILQPIVVRPAPAHPAPVTPQGTRTEPVQRFVLILGERRFRASKIAGKTTIPAIVKRVSEQQAAEMTLVENLQRQDLDCLEQAAAFANLSTKFDLTQEEIGKRVGVSREQVSNYLRLLNLPPEVMEALRRKELTYSHARLLLSLDDDEQITKVARVVIAKKMSVALLMELVTDAHSVPGTSQGRKPGAARWQDPNVRAAQRSLEASLGMKVRINDKRGKGKILIEYSTLEDFDRIVEKLQRTWTGESRQ